MWVNITVTHEDYTELWSDLHTLYCENSGVEGSRGRHGHQTRQTAGEGWGPGGANDRRLPVSRGPLRWSRVTYEIGYAPIVIFQPFLLSHFPCNAKYMTLHRAGNLTHYQVYKCVTIMFTILKVCYVCARKSINWCQVKNILSGDHYLSRGDRQMSFW